jgi:hypothetical protein
MPITCLFIGRRRSLAAFGADLSVQTMCGWMGQTAGLLDPLYDCLKDFVLSLKVVGTDDTPVKVLDRNLPQTRKGRIWPYVGDRDHPAVIYDYTPTRERAGPEEFLKDFKGICRPMPVSFTTAFSPIRSAGWWRWAARRMRGVTSINALENDKARMGGVLAMIAHLYGVEKAAREKGLRGEELRLVRERELGPCSFNCMSI